MNHVLDPLDRSTRKNSSEKIEIGSHAGWLTVEDDEEVTSQLPFDLAGWLTIEDAPLQAHLEEATTNRLSGLLGACTFACDDDADNDFFRISDTRITEVQIRKRKAKGEDQEPERPFENFTISVVEEEAPKEDLSNIPYEYAMVFKNEVGEGDEWKQSELAKSCYHALTDASLDVYAYLSCQDDETIFLIRAPTSVLEAFAEEIEYKVILDEEVAKARFEEGGTERNAWGVRRIKGAKISEDKIHGDFLPPFRYIYGRFHRRDTELYAKRPEDGQVLTKLDRKKLLSLMFEYPTNVGGCNLPIPSMLERSEHTVNYLESCEMLGYFPLHDAEAAASVQKKMLSWKTVPWTVPLDEMRDYFGEKFALLFLFMDHFTHSLRYPAIVGFCFQVLVWKYDDYSHPSLPFFGLLMSFWAIIFLEFWKRKQVMQALKWGMVDYKQAELVRPDFVGVEIKSITDGSPYLYFPTDQQAYRHRTSVAFTMLYLLFVLSALGGIYFFRQTNPSSYTVYEASLMNATLITLSTVLFRKVAFILTEYENHRTDEVFEDALVTKVFVFNFINSFTSFFFIAFVAPWVKPKFYIPGTLGSCRAPNCMRPLGFNLIIIFGARLTATNMIDIGIAWFFYAMKHYIETAGVDPSKMTPAEKDYVLVQFEDINELVYYYSDLTINYGYMVLFVVGLPLSPALLIINCYAQQKFIVYKHIQLYQRPPPHGAEDIGAWESIFTLLSFMAVMTNAGLITFTMSVLDGFTPVGKFWVFVGFQWFLFSMQYLIEAYIDDTPREVVVQLQRTKVIVSKLIDKVPDPDADDPPMSADRMTINAAQNSDKKKLSLMKARARTRPGGNVDVPIQQYNWQSLSSKASTPETDEGRMARILSDLDRQGSFYSGRVVI